MKTMIFAAAAMLSLGLGSAAYADGDGPQANTQFTQIPGVVAQAPVQNAQSTAMAQSGQAAHRIYVTSSDRGTWLFAPSEYGG